MEDNLVWLIYYGVPGTIIVSLVIAVMFIVFRRSKTEKILRIVGITLSFLGFISSLALLFLLLAHPYMRYAVISASGSLLVFLYLYFSKNNR